MVGAALACILSRGGIKIALIENNQPILDWDRHIRDLRVSALTVASQNIFETLDVWNAITARSVNPYRHMRVWDSDSKGELHFDGADAGVDIMGYIVENRAIVAALWESIANYSETTIFCPTNVTHLQCKDQYAELSLQDGGKIRAQLIVGADGKSSLIRKLAGIATIGWPYQQQAMVAYVETVEWNQQTAYQRFLPTGPLAFLPISKNDFSIVWSADNEMTSKNIKATDQAFIRTLNKASNGMVCEVTSIGERASFPLELQFAKQYTDNRVVLIGDAAHSVHPLAGQGVNLGLLDAAALAELILDAKFKRRPLSSSRVLRGYERWRKLDNLVMLGTLDLIKRTYGINNKAFNQIRAIGMNFINSNLPFKNFFNRYAMGFRNDLPKLASGTPCWRVTVHRG